MAYRAEEKVGNMKGFAFFHRTSKRGCYNLAGYHDPRSLTWSWVLSVSFDSWARRLSPGPLAGKVGQMVFVRIPLVCEFHFHWQRKMIINPARS